MARPKTKTNAQIKNDYARKAYDDIRLQVKKGKKEIIKGYADAAGESLNAYIGKAIDECMERAIRKGAADTMSEREQVMQIIDAMPEYKITGLLAFLRTFEEIPNDETIEAMRETDDCVML